MINRSTFVYAVLFWPAAVAVAIAFKGWFRILLGLVLAVTAVAIVTVSTHQSSQLSIAVSIAVFALAFVCQRCARVVVVAGVAALYLLVVPFSLYAYQSGWHLDKEVMKTARARLIYWAYTSERVLERPLLGVGTAATEAIDSARPKASLEKPRGFVVPLRTTAHPHNSYLQIWYETGALGALTALALHLGLFWRTFRVQGNMQNAAIAFFVLVTAITAPSYGLWQAWFQSAVGIAAVMLVLTVRQSDSRTRTTAAKAT